MKIAIDYDKTYTADPELWNNFITMCLNMGHTPFICTYRDDRYDKTDDLIFLEQDDVEVVYTRGVAKKWWCEQFGPGNVDIWIDDKPERIFQNSDFPIEQLKAWRAEGCPKEV